MSLENGQPPFSDGTQLQTYMESIEPNIKNKTDIRYINI